MADLVTSAAVRPSLHVVQTVCVNVAHVATHGAEVVHVNDWGGGRMHRGVLQLGGVRDEGEVDEHSGGRGVDCGGSVTGVSANQTCHWCDGRLAHK